MSVNEPNQLSSVSELNYLQHKFTHVRSLVVTHNLWNSLAEIGANSTKYGGFYLFPKIMFLRLENQSCSKHHSYKEGQLRKHSLQRAGATLKNMGCNML